MSMIEDAITYMSKTIRQFINELERLANTYGDDIPVVVRTYNKRNPYKKYTYENVYIPKIICPKTNPRVLVNTI